jgi:hypothetical protein
VDTDHDDPGSIPGNKAGGLPIPRKIDACAGVRGLQSRLTRNAAEAEDVEWLI